MSDIGVIHLVRARNGIEPFKQFLASYRENPGGMAHDLLIIFKGFHNKEQLKRYTELLAGIPYKSIKLADYGYDIRAYFAVVKAFPHQYFCFLNSFSVLLDENWLKKLYEHITRLDVGLVGSSGSYESAYSNALRHRQSNVFFLRKLIRSIWLGILGIYFDPFPNQHIRTNGFMLSRDSLVKIRTGFIITKMDAHRFESGKNSLTKQIISMNKKAMVIGKNGKGYDIEDWPISETFRKGDQLNLLIADNQTKAYMNADPKLKAEMTRLAWGAEPAR